ncbi:MAG TPA: single-stranded DNA-binding protein [Flexistipes sinusarabici]|uniref:Single-stranded DNA-binding protein n=1 Tax=Flexistipes sinusarabici TaxID=2352 RepID=A0A3D5QAP9_FLESI|nr:single-stranded DNA-binding protein [Flexistipes sinusarabici]
MNIYEKIIEVRKVAGGFTKDTKGFNYEYVSGNQILSKIKDKMNEMKLLLLPVVTETAVEQIVTQSTDRGGEPVDKIEYSVSGKMEYHWVDADKPEDKVVVPWALFGMQNDPSKAFGSALTYSERYFYLKCLGLPTDEDDPDAKDTHEPETRKKNPAKTAPGGGRMIEISGKDTFKHRQEIKSLDGVFDYEKKVWKIPESRKDEAMKVFADMEITIDGVYSHNM